MTLKSLIDGISICNLLDRGRSYGEEQKYLSPYVACRIREILSLICFLWNPRHEFDLGPGIQKLKPANVLGDALGIQKRPNFVAWFPQNQC